VGPPADVNPVPGDNVGVTENKKVSHRIQ